MDKHDEKAREVFPDHLNGAIWDDARKRVAQVLREASPQRQPIETAPRDGTPILLFDSSDGFPFIGYWGRVGRYTSSIEGWMGHEYGYVVDNDLSGWMPLPSPPEDKP